MAPKPTNPKYLPFWRTDINNGSYFFVAFTQFFFIPRFLFALSIMLYAFITTQIICIGADKSNLSGIRRQLIIWNTIGCMYAFAFNFTCMRFYHDTPTVDYSKWLGPDWKPEYDGASMIISNHTGWTEIFSAFFFIRPMPGFVAKQGVYGIPSVGLIAAAVGSHFMERTSKESRDQTLEMIQKRQESAIKGESPPIYIFPEGCGTNGNYLIKFKKGAFASLLPVKPYIIKNQSLFGNGLNLGSALGYWHYAFVIFSSVAGYASFSEMPVFAPNDYFWKNHWDGKDPADKWKVYAEAVREAMAKTGNLQLCDTETWDKQAYKNEIWGKLAKAD